MNILPVIDNSGDGFNLEKHIEFWPDWWDGEEQKPFKRQNIYFIFTLNIYSFVLPLDIDPVYVYVENVAPTHEQTPPLSSGC